MCVSSATSLFFIPDRGRKEVRRYDAGPLCETREQRTVLPTNIIMDYVPWPRGERFD
jgi:hypothetical protein